jgi:hypothetical protein
MQRLSSRAAPRASVRHRSRETGKIELETTARGLLLLGYMISRRMSSFSLAGMVALVATALGIVACSGAVSSSGSDAGSGGDAATGDATSSACPARPPDNSTACTGNPSCNYGCDNGGPSIAQCKDGFWFIMGLGVSCPAPDAGNPGPEPPDASDPTNPVTTCNADGKEFGPFDKTCSGDMDCAFGSHQTSCCGDGLAIGFNKSQQSAFDAAEKECDTHFPGCGCPTRGTTTEENADGGFYIDPSQITVKCDNGKCMTTPK